MNTWVHVALVRNGSAANIYVNGQSIGSDASVSGSFTDLTGYVYAGANVFNSTAYLNGWLDEYRVSTTARWTSNFTPPSSPYNAPTSTPTPTATPQGTTLQQKTYTYSGTIPHAVIAVSGQQLANSYEYDANGNMTCRVEAGITYKQTYNAENRIASIQKLASGDCTAPGDLTTKWDFAYDGDGTRAATLTTPYISGVPQTPVLTAYYFGGAYEVTGSTVKKYYSFGGQSILRDSTGLQYLLTDHLGSTVAVTDDTGTLISEQRYLPFGGVRTNVGSITQTDFGYTGQRDDSYIKLMDYDFRWYGPELARFISPDSIVPNPANPQSLNRYSYVGNRPVNFNDPTGHVACQTKEDCQDMGTTPGAGLGKLKHDEEDSQDAKGSEESCLEGTVSCDDLEFLFGFGSVVEFENDINPFVYLFLNYGRPAWRHLKGFGTLTPAAEGVLGFWMQVASDGLTRPDLNGAQIFARSAIVGGENAITDLASTAFGVLVGAPAGALLLGGKFKIGGPVTLVAASGGALAGYTIGSYSANAILEYDWFLLNRHWIFNNEILGGYP